MKGYWRQVNPNEWQFRSSESKWSYKAKVQWGNSKQMRGLKFKHHRRSVGTWSKATYWAWYISESEPEDNTITEHVTFRSLKAAMKWIEVQARLE